MKIKQSVKDSGCSKTEINRETKPELEYFVNGVICAQQSFAFVDDLISFLFSLKFVRNHVFVLHLIFVFSSEWFFPNLHFWISINQSHSMNIISFDSSEIFYPETPLILLKAYFALIKQLFKWLTPDICISPADRKYCCLQATNIFAQINFTFDSYTDAIWVAHQHHRECAHRVNHQWNHQLFHHPIAKDVEQHQLANVNHSVFKAKHTQSKYKTMRKICLSRFATNTHRIQDTWKFYTSSKSHCDSTSLVHQYVTT